MSPRETDGEVAECASCGWRHRPSQACPKSKPPQGPLQRPTNRPDPERSAAELTAGFRQWEERVKAQPTVYEPTGRTCPVCAGVIYRATNFLGVVFEVVGDDREPLEEHQARCKAPAVQTLPTLQVPRRAGLPYPDD